MENRSKILALWRNPNYLWGKREKSKVERIPLLELENAQEVFLTSSSHLVCPIIKIDNKLVGNGVTGDLTAKLKKRFLYITQGKDELFNNWLENI